MDKLIVIFVVCAAVAVVPLPAVLLVPVAGDQMAQPLVAEGRKGEHVPEAALLVRDTNFFDRLVCLFCLFCFLLSQYSPLQPYRRSSQLAVRADEKRNCRIRVDRGAGVFVPGHRPSSLDRPWSRGGRTRRSWRGICGKNTRCPRTFCTARGGAWTGFENIYETAHANGNDIKACFVNIHVVQRQLYIVYKP